MIKNSINEKLVLSFVLIGTFAIVLVSSVTFYYQKNALLDRTFDQLTSLRYVKKKMIENYFENRLHDIDLISSSYEFNKVLESMHNRSEGTVFYNGHELDKLIGQLAMSNQNYSGYSLLIDQNQINSLGINISDFAGEAFLFETKLDNMMAGSSIGIGKQLMGNEEFMGLFILHISPDIINKLVYEDDPEIGLGKTGETYLVGSDYYMKSNSRFTDNSYADIKVKTHGVVSALNENEGSGIFDDYRGVEVLSSYTILRLPGLNWVLLAEIDYKEALIPIDKSRSTIMFIGIILMTITFLVAFLTAKTISAPIVKLKEASINVGQGNFNLQLDRSSNDEIGELTDTFNAMVSQLKSQTEELHERGERLKHFYEATHDGIVLHKHNKTLLFNQAISKLSGYTEAELYDKKMDDIVLNYQLLINKKINDSALVVESILQKKNGLNLQIEIQESQIEYKGQVINATVIRDISKRKAVENDLKTERRRRLRAVIDGQDAERQRLSRELHDGLGQNLIATKLKLEMTTDKKSSESVDIIREIGESFDKTIDEVRRISNNLMPAALAEFGIAAALRLLSEEMGEKKDLEVYFKSKGEFTLLTSQAKTYLFRIAQEALNNVIKHANAKSIKLSLMQNDFKVVLKIEDDGCGFDPQNIQSISSNGLYNMRERVNLLQGSLEIFSLAGKGTQISVTIPIDNM
ncbi:MAG: HAMP domain-containing protein [Bacteroidetes bacterium]|nr:HAMP domain-containing protein [Bacteroidota bacterium]